MLNDVHLDTTISIMGNADRDGLELLLWRLLVKGVLGDVPVFWFEVLPY